MFRSMLSVFIGGWMLWFWIDKPDPRQYPLPPVSDSVTENFQRAFDMLKGGYPEIAFLYIWDAHYLILSLLGGLMLVALWQSVSRTLSRRRMRRDYLPPRQKRANRRMPTRNPDEAQVEKHNSEETS